MKTIEFLCSPVGEFNKIKKSLANSLSLFVGDKIIDLLLHLPMAIVDRQNTPSVLLAENGQVVTIEARVMGHKRPLCTRNAASHSPHYVFVQDKIINIRLVFFNVHSAYIEQKLPLGKVRLISGKIQKYHDTIQIIHPDYMLTPEQIHLLPKIESIYPLTKDISSKSLKEAILECLEELGKIARCDKSWKEWVPSHILRKKNWPSFLDSLYEAHHPTRAHHVHPFYPARLRLSFDELLSHQLGLRCSKININQKESISIKIYEDLFYKYYAEHMGFSLTQGQINAIDCVKADMKKSKPMLRLLQGDVGSGKTLVAIFAILTTAQNNCQSAFMAPTEILAKQHFDTLFQAFQQFGIHVVFLSGGIRGKKRAKILEEICNGQASVVIGTHALLSKDVVFQKLVTCIIDEQHKFGVEQRFSLLEKAKQEHIPHTLLLTATPIPRTLSLMLYGNIDITLLKDKPLGRLPIITSIVSVEKLDELINRLKKLLNKKEKIYWVCPLIQESEKLDLQAAETRYSELQVALPDYKIALIHGAMKNKDKESVMHEFKEKTLQVLVATSVVEVGLDIKEASLIIIENAERFGLAQLHQLRGRVGRFSIQSYCILLYQQPLSIMQKQRLSVMRHTNDGFVLADMDLKLRGPGDITGLRQSGLPQFKITSPQQQEKIIDVSVSVADIIVKKKIDLAENLIKLFTDNKFSSY